ncbi:MAG TPA: hypothetical protein VNF73_00200 [Candidatus Saccharimonadales bacterium]|nr:hypothetical protein [Candidatus Saccharimonadales bacterium]
MDDKTEVHIRQWIEKRTRRPVPDLIWEDLREDGFVRDATTRDGLDDLLRAARRALRYVDLGARGEAAHRQPSASGRASIRSRARAFEALVAQEMDLEPAVARIRQWWGGGTLSRDEAIERAQSPSWCLLLLSQLRSDLGPGRSSASTFGQLVRTNESRVILEESERRGPHAGMRWKIELRWGSWDHIADVWVSDSAMESVVLPVRGGDTIRVGAASWSLMGQVADVARGLARQAPWTAEDAAWFVMTGDPPPVAPLLFGVERRIGPGYHRAVVKLEIEPWIPHEIVLAAYRQAQAEVLPKANRALGERTTELALFFAGSTGTMSVGAAMRIWNDLNPNWAEHDRRNFQRHVRDAQRLIARPPWRPFG